jgi:diguanylate cyclase (GGDEF)-like protein/PAS domain S-box-containing protein
VLDPLPLHDHVTDDPARLQRRLDRERRARLDAETIAERTTRELFESLQALRQAQVEASAAGELVLLLQRVTMAANEAETLEAAAQAALDAVCAHTGWPIGHLYVVNPQGDLDPTGVWCTTNPERTALFREVTERTVLRAGEGLPGQVVEAGAPVWIADVMADSNFPRARVGAEMGVHGAFGLPVLVGDDVVGVLEFFAESVMDADAGLLELMRPLGVQLGRVVERSRAAAALTASEERTREVIETANDAFIAIDVDSCITEWNRQAEQTFGWTRAEAVGRQLAELIIPPVHRAAHAEGIANFLRSGVGPVLGRRVELTALHRDGREFPIELTPWAVEDGASYRFNAFVHDISERKTFERQLEHQALHDPLTSLPNRVLLLDRLRHALARGRRDRSSVALLFIDLDRFKAVNDSLGHEAGDRVLIGVADRVTGVLRPGDTVARLGGDEFIILCEDVQTKEDVTTIADRVLACLNQPFALPGGDAFISCSIGIALATADDRDAEELLGDADMAMYRAKERGKGVYDVFDETMRAELVQRLSSERALRRAIGANALHVVYQPIVSLGTTDMIGVEALARWEDPERGSVSPLEFIPLAEEAGLIGVIGQTVLREACAQLRRCQQRSPEVGLTMAVNLSIRQLEQPGFVDELAALIDDAGVAPSSLTLEITETVFTQDAEAIIRRLWAVRELGVGLALDDFGTGYSSLDRLRDMPVQKLKIDKSFIDEVDSRPGGTALLAAIIAMAHSLGLSAVAEGVEHEAQLANLGRLGCDEVQGYLLSRPVSGTEIESLLSRPDCLWPRHLAPSTPESIEAELMRVVAQAARGRGDLESTTRSLMAELQRLVSQTASG